MDALAVLRRGVDCAGNSTHRGRTDVDRFEVDYLANITIGGQDFTVIGLAFPNVTAVVSITDGQRAPYDPFFFTAVKQKKLNKPIFSISIDRGTFEGLGNDPVEHNVGFLSFGGIPPVPVVNTSVTVPIQGYSADGIPSDGPDASFFSTRNNTILDSGTTFNLLPNDVAAVFAAQFDPPANLTTNPLTAAGVTLGGKTFSIDPRPDCAGYNGNGTIVCASGTQPISAVGAAFQGQFLLGDVFLHNVVSTFNPIDGEVTLTQRAAY
ncbi:aspartic peptidase domain-containing protein [Mycena olivaceomarginata]|nr:aspartic peptidase domain-containing protein [Mycena olivaceomarginata]